MIRKLQILLTLSAFLLTVSCSDEDKGLAEAPAPTISLPMEEIDVDLNKVDNPPVVAIIKSQAGLKNVTMEIETAEGINEYKTVTDFFNSASYSLSEELIYDNTYQAFIIKATDKQNQVTEGKILFNVTDVVGKPVIEFDPQEIIYDEMDENPVMPNTAFKVTSDGGLKNVSMLLVSSEGETEYKTEGLNGDKEYTFNELISYKNGDRGLKVKAEDNYGNITIETLPVTYRSIPGPVILDLPSTLNGVRSSEKIRIPISVTSQRGIETIEVLAVKSDASTSQLEKFELEKVKEYNDEIEVQLDASTVSLNVVVSDGREEMKAERTVKAYVDMTYAKLLVGAACFANAPHSDYPGAYSIISCEDLKTHSVDEVLANNRIADFRFYCHGSAANLRFYSMSVTGNLEYSKEGDYKGSDGKTLQNMNVRNNTIFSNILSGFDFDNATASSISSVSSFTATLRQNLEVGQVFCFQTDEHSTAGKRKGVMKITDVTGQLISNNSASKVLTVEILLELSSN